MHQSIVQLRSKLVSTVEILLSLIQIRTNLEVPDAYLSSVIYNDDAFKPRIHNRVFACWKQKGSDCAGVLY